MKVLGIETSCDETAAAVIEDGVKILSNQIISQVEIHARYGGIVPEVASRQHILSIIPIIKRTISEAKVDWKEIDGIAVTCGPGLAGSLSGRREYRKGDRVRQKPAAHWGQPSRRPYVR